LGEGGFRIGFLKLWTRMKSNIEMLRGFATKASGLFKNPWNDLYSCILSICSSYAFT
jgi:hypothetical protein